MKILQGFCEAENYIALKGLGCGSFNDVKAHVTVLEYRRKAKSWHEFFCNSCCSQSLCNQMANTNDTDELTWKRNEPLLCLADLS